MDSNLMSCPTCGHSVSNIAGACAYCGAMMTEAGKPPQADNQDAVKKAPAAASPPPLPQAQIRPAAKTSDEAGEARQAATEPSGSDASAQPADSSARAETLTPGAKSQTASPGESTAVEDETHTKPVVDEPELKPAPPSDGLDQDLEDNSEIALTETVGPESAPAADAAAAPDDKPGSRGVPEGETINASENVVASDRPENPSETAPDSIQSAPQPEAADISEDETAESEAIGEAPVEPGKIEAAAQETASPATPEMPPSLEKPGEKAESRPAQDMPPKNDADLADDAKAGSTSKSLGDTIVLEVEDEVEPAAAAPPDTTQETAHSESRAEAQSIKNKPTAGSTKAQTLKKQKAAQAKVQALKRQKLVLAKAAALKRKKEIQAKAQANTETAKDKVSAGAAPAPKSVPGPAANSRMQTLLDKYKGRMIGINYDNSADIRKAQFVEANTEYFSVFVKEQNLKYSYPLKAVLSVIEGKDGVDIGNSKEPKKFVAVIKLYPMVLF